MLDYGLAAAAAPTGLLPTNIGGGSMVACEIRLSSAVHETATTASATPRRSS